MSNTAIESPPRRTPPPMRLPVVVDVQDVWKAYDGDAIGVLYGCSFSIRRGETVALWGISGSGKSTLLNLVGGLDLPDRGCISVCGIKPQSEGDRLKLRREKVGFVYQLHNLIPDLSAAENCRAPALAAGLSRQESDARIRELAEATGIAHRLEQSIQKLSGGERQRAAICRALVNHPEVILADEPTGALDEGTGQQVFELLKTLARENGTTALIATHERCYAESCDRILCVRDGRITEL